MMLNLRIPQCVADKLDELTALCEENPMNLTVRQVAKFLGVDANSLRAAIECGNCPFGLGWQKEIHGNRGFHIPTATFYLWYTQGVGYRK